MQTTATWTVLLVEDNPGDANLVRQCMEPFPGIDLFHVPNAVQANRFLMRKPPFENVPVPDLVLLDLRMPIFDGSSVLEGLIDLPLLDQTAMVVFTSSMLPSDEERCRRLGANDYVNKPVDWQAWQLTIHRILHDHLKRFAE
jgi:CheY-like chemotaxis protein